MKHLFLFGGGEAPNCNALDRILLSRIGRDNKILYIPVADEDGDFLGGFKYFKNNFEELGHTQFDMWISLYNKTYSELEEYGAVYLAGGNTYLLNSILRKSGFDNLLQRYAGEGHPIYGDSAGAIVLGNDISTASLGEDSDDDIIGDGRTAGLEILENVTVHCHYEPADNSELLELSRLGQSTVVALTETAGLEIEGDTMRVIGNDPVILFQNNRMYQVQPDQSITFNLLPN